MKPESFLFDSLKKINSYLTKPLCEGCGILLIFFLLAYMGKVGHVVKEYLIIRDANYICLVEIGGRNEPFHFKCKGVF